MKTQHGVGLVELMISMVIGMLLILGLGLIFFSMKQTSILREQMSAVQNYERTGMMFMETDVESAGYYPGAASGVLPSVQFPAISPAAGGTFVAGQAISGTGNNSNADTLSVRFAAAPSGATQGCSANLTANDIYIDVFKINSPYLQCTEYDINPATNAVNTTKTVNLIGGSTIGGNTIGLTGMNVRYGVDTNGNGSVTQYFPANTVPNWANVKTVQIQLIFTNPLCPTTQSCQPGQPAAASGVSLSQTIPNITGL